MSRLLAAQRALTVPGWVKDELWRRARATPSLDLRFADSKSLVDATTGQNLVTFTRASGGTYVDSQGVIRNAVTNLLLRSEEFDNANWTKQQASVSANAITAPNGTLTADKLIEDSSNNIHQLYRFETGLIAGTAYAYSVYAKAGERSSFVIDLRAVGSGFRSVFNLATGTASGTAVGSGTLINAAIQAVGDGWYRCSVTGSHPTDTALNTVIRINNPAGTDTYTGDGTSGIYLWGAQLEQSSTVGEYIPTGATINSAPRFDHNPTTGESLGLLVEEQRTNLLLRSAEINDAAWFKFNTTVSPNVATSPDGSQTADNVIPNAATGLFYVSQTVTTVVSTTYTFSFYAKANGFSWIFADAFDGTNHRTWFNLANGTLGTVAAGTTAAISAAGNGWYRCSISLAAGAASIPYAIAVTSANNVFTGVTGNGVNGVLVWGAQLEAGAFPTSYIPTTTAAATRSADVASITGSAFSGFYRQDEGTMFADCDNARPVSGGNQFAFRASDGTYTNTVALNIQSSGLASLSTAAAGVFDGIATTATGFSANVQSRMAGAYKSNGLACCFAGGALATDATVTIPTALTRADIGSDHAGLNRFGSGHIRRLTYWGQRLGNEVLQRITQ